MFEKLNKKYPHLYACKVCGEKVKVTVVEGSQPIIKRSCGCPEDTIVIANRKVCLNGVAEMNKLQKAKKFIKQKFINFLCWITGRSI